MKKIPMGGEAGKGYYALVDDEDYDRLKERPWHLTTRNYAATCYAPGNSERMHRVIMKDELSGGESVDHINGDKLDNRRANLRVVSHSGNLQNQAIRSRGNSMWRGVHREQRWGKWIANAGRKVNGKKIKVEIGYFHDEDLAGMAASLYRSVHMPYSPDARMSLDEIIRTFHE